MSNINFTSIQPEGWERGRGHAHAVVSQGSKVIHISGFTGRNADGSYGSIPQQFENSLKKIVEVMKTAGGDVENITMMRIYCSNPKGYRAAAKEVGGAYRNVLGKHFPAMMFVGVTELMSPDAAIEIDAEGVLP